MTHSDDKGPDELDAPAAGPAPVRLTPPAPARIDFHADSPDDDGANDEALGMKMQHMEQEHRDLDAAILALETSGSFDPLSLKRLKKRKLVLKDLIAKIRDQIDPDIIA